MPHCHKQCKKENEIKLVPSYPWEIIKENVKCLKFIVVNLYPESFDHVQVQSIAETIEKYIKKYLFPSWRVSIDISVYTSPSLTQIQADFAGGNVGPADTVGTYIPIYLVNEFASTVAHNFAVAVHGIVSGSVMNGPDARTYLGSSIPTAFLPYGTPFVVIPAGSTTTGNGINSAVAHNISNPSLGPISFYQCLSVAMSHEIIEVLLNPTGALYIGGGNTFEAGEQFFYLREAVDPVSQGIDNIFNYKSWDMCNFCLPSYFFPFNISGKYDFLGKTTAPFKPYKGTQTFLYQKAVNDVNVTDLEIRAYVSAPATPNTITTVNNGSIYTYTGWGLKFDDNETPEVNPEVDNPENENGEDNERGINKKSDRFSIGNKAVSSSTTYSVINSGVQARRQQNGSQLDAAVCSCEVVCEEVLSADRCSQNYECSKTEPELLPFQFIDDDGVLTIRFVLINYVPQYLLPAEVDKAIPALEKYMEENYLPHWNCKAKILRQYVSPDVPAFDGTFIPFFYINNSMVDPAGSGYPLYNGGGAWNLNNVPNSIAGPMIQDHLLNSPILPLGNPYLLVPEGNWNRPAPQLTINAPNPAAGVYQAGSATFGPAITGPLSGKLVLADPILANVPLNNAAAINGNIAVVRRGSGTFVLKVKTCQDAGAIGVVVCDNTGGDTISGMGGSDPTIVIPSLRISQNAGNALIANITGTTTGIMDKGTSADKIAINSFTDITAHEMEELCSDPHYSMYITTSNPPVDKAILFNQYEASDPVERSLVNATVNGRSYAMDAFPTPSFFVANMKFPYYDNVGVTQKPLIPGNNRQQTVFQSKGGPLLTGSSTTANFGQITVSSFGSIFDHNTFYPTGIPPVDAATWPVASSPLASIYTGLTQDKYFF